MGVSQAEIVLSRPSGRGGQRSEDALIHSLELIWLTQKSVTFVAIQDIETLKWAFQKESFILHLS